MNDTERDIRIIDLERRITNLANALNAETDYVRRLLIRVGVLEQQIGEAGPESNTVKGAR